MIRASLATACLVLAACSAPGVPPPVAFGRPTDSLLAAKDPQPPAAAPAASESELRAQLASGPDPVGAALQLVHDLDAEARQREALVVLDAALSRAPTDAALHVARAGVLRDLGQRHLALAELRTLVAKAGVASIHPGLLYELAELQWLEGDRDGSRATLRDLIDVHGSHEWNLAHAGELRQLQQDLAAAPAPTHLSVRDLLGNLRGCPDPAERLAALDRLVALGGETAARAVAAGLDDEDARVRAAAVRHAEVAETALAELCATALTDRAPAVRCAGAARAARLPAAAAAAVLLPVLGAESDADAFAAEHAALRAGTGAGPELPAAAAADPAARAAVVAAWRKLWPK